MAATGFLGAGAFPTQLTEAEFESARYNELDDMVADDRLGLPRPVRRLCPLPRPQVRPDPVATTTTGWPPSSRRRSAARSTWSWSRAARPTKVQVTAEGFPHTKHHADDRGFPALLPEDLRPRTAAT